MQNPASNILQSAKSALARRISSFLAQNDEQRSHPGSPSWWLQQWFGGAASETASGQTVDSDTALQLSTVYACLDLISSAVGSLPCILYRQQGEERERATDHPLYYLLHDEPNPDCTSFTFFSTGTNHCLAEGNSYALIERNRRGTVTQLMGVMPGKMEVSRGADGSLQYVRTVNNQQEQPYRADQVIHVPAFGVDYLTGMSPIAVARETIGLGLAAQEFGGRFFGQGTSPAGVIEEPKSLGEKSAANLRASLDTFRSTKNAHRVLVLEGGQKYTPIGIRPEDAQFIGSRQFTREEVCAIYHVPPHLVGAADRMTYASVEQSNLSYVVHCIRPWLVRWERELNRKLLTKAERQAGYYCEFLAEALLRGDTASRFSAYATGRQWGWLSANDVRRLENMNRIDGGDQYLTPANMSPVGQQNNGGENA